MLIDLKSMLNKLTTPRTGFTVVKLTTASNVGLYVRDLNTESKVIKIGKDSYVFHVQSNDVILQGQYARGRKIHVVENLSELNNGYQLAQLDGGNNFYTLVEIPAGFRRKHIDDSLSGITRTFVSLLSGVDLTNVNCLVIHPIADVKFTLLDTAEDYDAIKAKRSVLVEIRRDELIRVMSHLNYNTGCIEFVIWMDEASGMKEATINLVDGMFIEVIGKRAQLMFDTDVYKLGNDVLNQITKPFKREEETNVTKDAESVKLD